MTWIPLVMLLTWTDTGAQEQSSGPLAKPATTAPKSAEQTQIEQLQRAVQQLESKLAQTRPQTDQEARQANGKAIKAVCTARGLKFSHAAVEADGKITVTCR